MKRFKSISLSFIFCVIVFLGTVRSFGQDVTNSLLETTKVHTIQSNFNSKIYQLYVSLPKNYSTLDTTHYPVLYVLDGRFSFTSFHSIREVLDLGKEIKNVIIVAIHANGETETDWFADRYFDFTPSSLPRSDTQWSKMMNIPIGKLKSGGSELFLLTIQQDILPFIDKHYKATADLGISGHSLGGLFVGYCLVKEPDLFNRYGINSPSFWWNNNEMLSIENTMAKQRRSISANVFFSAGALEGEMMLAPIISFINSLKNHEYIGLHVKTQIFDNETHLSVVSASSSRTLKVLYGSNVK